MFAKIKASHYFLDRVACMFMRRRLKLPKIDLSILFPDYDQQPVTLRQLPRGSWSTPLADIVVLLKVVRCTAPHRLLEVGSFRGYTTLLMAEHAPLDAQLVAVDSYVDHGEAYRHTPLAERIERRVCATGPDAFTADGPGTYDFTFIDADHFYEGVRRDTELVLPLVAPRGFVLWHDYANWGYFNRTNGVPEYLHELAERIPIAHIPGTDLAIHCPAWQDADRELFDRAIAPAGGIRNEWISAAPRG